VHEAKLVKAESDPLARKLALRTAAISGLLSRPSFSLFPVFSPVIAEPYETVYDGTRKSNRQRVMPHSDNFRRRKQGGPMGAGNSEVVVGLSRSFAFRRRIRRGPIAKKCSACSYP